jgi:hypothetical protein
MVPPHDVLLNISHWHCYDHVNGVGFGLVWFGGQNISLITKEETDNLVNGVLGNNKNR